MYAFCQDMPGITMDDQRELSEQLAPDALDKCIAHVVGPIDGGVRMIDVWESEADYRQFMKDHLYPTLARIQQGQPLTDTSGVAAFTVLEVTGVGHATVGSR